MKPLKLKLQGFTGIIKGLGKDTLELDLTTIPADKKLVAFVGVNGNGKSTILDNLHPYRVMPSHSTTLGPGGFSYWDHLSGLTAAKELEWEHGSRRYRTSFSFKTKSRKADYYLYVWADAQQAWEPFSTPDGIRSDSKADTYDKCVDSILGIPERFFTSQFAAQRRKALSSYGSSDVKSLLASILNLQLFGQLGSKAAAVAKLLKFQLDSLQEDLGRVRSADASIEETKRELALHEMRAADLARQVAASEHASTLAHASLAALLAKRDSHAKDIEEAAFLQSQIDNTTSATGATKARAVEHHRMDLNRIASEISRLDGEVRDARTNLTSISSEIDRLNTVIVSRHKIEQANAAIPTLRAQISQSDVVITDNQKKLAGLVPLRNRMQVLAEQLANIQAAGEGKKLMLIRLTETAALVDVVPCKGLQLQESCQLLSHANDAHAKIPTDTREYQKLKSDYKQVLLESREVSAKLEVASTYEAAIEQATSERKLIQSQLDLLLPLAARTEVLELALVQLPAKQLSKQTHSNTIEKSSHSSSILNASMKTVIAEHEANLSTLDKQHASEIFSLQQRLNSLSKPVSEEEITRCKNRIADADKVWATGKAQQLAHTEGKVNLLAKIEVLNNMKEKSQETVAQASRLQDEIASWKLLEKCMGNDGLVALSIDDAGPEISLLCNELLADDVEGRFTVRLDTQRELSTGSMKETFDIMVFDGRGGKETPISLMSGGEQVWVNGCLTRAIALHISDTSAMDYKTLFTDEDDGAFDPARKRQFMQMKRKVLDRGRYEREYFISQTPEVWELADHIIHMDTLK
ncbi:hypothetical protein LPN04_29890 [Rugamonas sp. A1-17]|nr:hypothetical protein [Rugamonas sp. A1-17]